MIDVIIGLAQELKAERMKTAALEEEIARDRAKVKFAEAVEASDSSMLIETWQKFCVKTEQNCLSGFEKTAT